MTLTSKQITDAIEAQPGAAATPGRLAAIRRFAAGGQGDHPERQFLDALAAVPPPKRDPAYRNPITVHATAAKPEPLTASDVAWLQRLPTDPEQISYGDARTLSRMAANVQPGTGDERLVQSILAPVRQLHDGRAAAVKVANLQRLPTPDPPAGAHTLLAQAIARETPGLTDQEAAGRARTQLDEAVARRDSRRAGQIAEAEAKAAVASRPYNAGDMAEHGDTYRALAQTAARTGSHDATAAIAEHDDALRTLHDATFGAGSST